MSQIQYGLLSLKEEYYVLLFGKEQYLVMVEASVDEVSQVLCCEHLTPPGLHNEETLEFSAIHASPLPDRLPFQAFSQYFSRSLISYERSFTFRISFL